MKKSTYSYLLMTITFLLLLASCGPSAASTAAPTTTIALTPTEPPTPAVHEGLADTLADFTLIKETEIASVVRHYRAIAQEPGFFPADAPSIGVNKTLTDAQAIALRCKVAESSCVADMGSFSVNVQRRDGVLVTQYYVVRAFNNAANTEDPNEKIVVLGCLMGESPYSHKWYEPSYQLEVEHMNDKVLRFYFQTGRSDKWTAGMAFDEWFDDEEFVQQMDQMKKQRQIWNTDKPVVIIEQVPAPY